MRSGGNSFIIIFLSGKQLTKFSAA